MLLMKNFFEIDWVGRRERVKRKREIKRKRERKRERERKKERERVLGMKWLKEIESVYGDKLKVYQENMFYIYKAKSHFSKHMWTF